MAHIARIILICAFLINVQGFDHVKTRHATEHHKIRSRKNTEEKPNCTCVDNSDDLKVIYNKPSGIVGIYNNRERVGLVIDINDNRVLIFNAKSHTTTVVNFKNQSGVITRNSRLQNIFKYLLTLKSLKTAEEANKKGSKSFNTSSVPDDVSKQLAPILKGLNPNYSSISNLTVDVQTLRTAFSNFSHVFGSGSGRFGGDFSSLAQRFKGLVDLLGKVNQNSTCQKKGKINLGEFLEQRTGLEAFVATVKQLSGSYNFSQLSGSKANSNQQLLTLISGFGSNANRFDRVWEAISHLYGFAQNKSSSNSSQTSRQLVRNVTYFFVRESSGSFQSQWQSGIQNALGQIGSNNSVLGLTDLLRNLTRPLGFVVNGIDLSSVIDALVNLNPLGLIFNIVKILVTLTLNLLNAVAELIVTILELLLVPNRIFRIRNFFPNITDSQVGLLSGPVTNILNALLRVLGLQSNLFDDGSEFWTGIPILGLVLGPLNEVLSILTKNEITLANVFESEESRTIIREGVLEVEKRENGGGEGQIVNPVQQTVEGVVTNLEGIVAQETNQSTSNAVQNVSSVSQVGDILSERHHSKNANLQKERHLTHGKFRKHERHHNK